MKEIIIFGMGASAVHCPFDKETWTCNNGFGAVGKHRLDKVFVTDKFFDRKYLQVNLMLKFQKEKGFELIVSSPPDEDYLKKQLDWKMYPIEEIMERFPLTDYYGNTICYMIAYALWLGRDKDHKKISDEAVDRIWFYGIDHLRADTYLYEKGATEHWMGIAAAIGVPIINTDGSAVGKTFTGEMYGHWEGVDLGSKVKQIYDRLRR